MPKSTTLPSAERGMRQRAVADARRALVLDAARAAFFELGLERASVREIARRAGYTPGAIYSYFASKEEMYGALLGESLERLNQAVAAARPGAARRGEPAEAATLRSAANAFFGFYRENPRDLDLGFYLFQGLQPRGLTPELNEQLNARLRAALAPAQRALAQLGLGERDALAEVTALFAHTVGLLLLSHTGRIRMFHQESQGLFDRYLDALVERALGRVQGAAR
ncbi:TetR/AcrR family transcriptional regulator [Methylibium petroleiphilum]|uniref:TetR/AcrR family transcriptional regulator n=1 Tax=Methylibium petroleiphilum TaxID=105560 RepID=UPI003D2BAD6C